MRRLTLLLAEVLLLSAPALFVLLASAGFSHRTADLFDATHRHNGELFAIAMMLWAMLVLRHLRDRPRAGEGTQFATPRGAVAFHNLFGLGATAVFHFLYITQGYMDTVFTRQWLPGIALVSLVYAVFWTIVYDMRGAGRWRRILQPKAR